PRLRTLAVRALGAVWLLGSSALGGALPARAATIRSMQHLVGTVCPDAQASPGAVSPQELRVAVICLTDQQRVRFGLPILSENPLLDNSAQRWTDSMVASSALTHGAHFARRITATGYDWSTVGENIGTGYSTPSEIVSAWMASSDHCRNILNP